MSFYTIYKQLFAAKASEIPSLIYQLRQSDEDRLAGKWLTALAEVAGSWKYGAKGMECISTAEHTQRFLALDEYTLEMLAKSPFFFITELHRSKNIQTPTMPHSDVSHCLYNGALRRACWAGNLELVKLLLAKNAEIDSPVYVAAISGSIQLLDFIMSKFGPDNWMSAMNGALSVDNVNIFEYAISHGKTIDWWDALSHVRPDNELYPRVLAKLDSIVDTETDFQERFDWSLKFCLPHIPRTVVSLATRYGAELDWTSAIRQADGTEKQYLLGDKSLYHLVIEHMRKQGRLEELTNWTRYYFKAITGKLSDGQIDQDYYDLIINILKTQPEIKAQIQHEDILTWLNDRLYWRKPEDMDEKAQQMVKSKAELLELFP